MTEERKQELKQLLGEAMESVKILPHSENRHSLPTSSWLSINAYREYLQQRWTSYSEKPLLVSLRFKPYIVCEIIESKLLDFIKEELAPFIHEDKILSASYRTEGDPINGFHLKKLRKKDLGLCEFLEHLLKIAIGQSIEEAASVFDKCMCSKGTQGFFQHVALLSGIWVEKEIQVCEGVRLVPRFGSNMPKLLENLPSLSIYAFHLEEDSFIRESLLIIDGPVFSIFHKSPSELFQDKAVDDLPIQFKLDGEKFPNSSAVGCFEKFFCQALSLACNSPVQIAGGRWFLADDAIFNPSTGQRMGRYPGMFGDPTEEVGEAQIDEAKRLYHLLAKLNLNDQGKLQVPIDRWIMSKTYKDPIDQMIDLGIAFEALYLSDIGETTELSFRLRLHAALHLREDKADRKALKKEFQEIYAWRSSVVHTGKLPKKKEGRKKRSPFTPEEVDEFIKRAQDLCRESIMKILEAGEFPNWDDLILG